MKKTKMLEKDKNIKDKIKDLKNLFRLKKEMDDRHYDWRCKKSS